MAAASGNIQELLELIDKVTDVELAELGENLVILQMEIVDRIKSSQKEYYTNTLWPF